MFELTVICDEQAESLNVVTVVVLGGEPDVLLKK